MTSARKTTSPEVGFTYHGFSGDFPSKMYRGVAGDRLAIGEILRPGVFAHIGAGHLQGDAPAPDSSHTALTYDGGLFLDFTLLPIFKIGIHGAYNWLNASSVDEGVGWVTAGAHAAIVF